MDGKEGMTSPEEDRISIVVENSSTASNERIGTGIDQDSNSFPTKSDVDKEWIREVEKKIDRAFRDSTLWRLREEDEKKPPICKLTLREISRRKLETVREFSRPRVVTIGPIQWKKSMDISVRYKWVIVGWMNALYSLDLADCLFTLKKEVENARGCYAALDISRRFYSKNNKRFAEMLLLDSYFILFVLTVKILKRPSSYTLMPITVGNFARTPRTLNLPSDDTTKVLDNIFNKDEIAPDLLILDNQIPFFVIEKLFEKLESDKPLHKYALDFFETIHPRRSTQGRKNKNCSTPPKFSHLLHLFHWSRVPQNKYIIPSSFSSPQQLDSVESSSQGCTDQDSPPPKFLHLLHLFHWSRVPENKYIIIPSSFSSPRLHIPNAMELRESATILEKKASGCSSLDITFPRRRFKRIIRVLNIPELHIRDYSSLILHNLIAFEMHSSNLISYCTMAFEMHSLSPVCCTMAFCALMRDLLQSEEDVKLLRRGGILASSCMADNELVDFFECLSKLTENHQMPSDLSTICGQVQSHHNQNFVIRFLRYLILWYFPNPVVTFSVCVAVLLFVPTLLQTIYSILSYVHR